ncbi:uncharacterized protein At3g50808-like [Herrania umbratica]|uniref:Uncharacterized protein At3g50808-like n=1 Tax=Herrania umbratica TaxID=108875 RepID=A0A6J1A4E1_9ROSI|nr:uncharacterized protein At3g50808-like [Herrania umbratica]
MGGNSLVRDLPWLKPLLQTEFYGSCECKSSKQCNFYCRDCMGSPFCENCNTNPRKHEGHGSLQVYKSSSRPGIKIRGIKDLMDVSDIQPYVCNSSKLVYIHRKRRQEHESRTHGRKGDKCEACGYELQCSTSKFCSIECKVNGEMAVEEETSNEEVHATSTTRPTCQPLAQAEPNSFRKRKRKGIPQRSPFF